MKNILKVLVSILFLSSCVELPNLLPSSNGEDSDMVIVEYNDLLANLVNGQILQVDDQLAIRFYFNGTGCDGSYDLQIVNGQILKSIEGDIQFLTQGDLIGGLVEGIWGYNIELYTTRDLFITCLVNFLIPIAEDNVIGIRFRDDQNQWHYGWVVLYVDNSLSYNRLFIKGVGYNKQPGTNVRIGG